jgi:hypothetical protein
LVGFFAGYLSHCLVLNEKVIQELLWIPPSLEVKNATCNNFLVKVGGNVAFSPIKAGSMDKFEARTDQYQIGSSRNRIWRASRRFLYARSLATIPQVSCANIR